VNDLDIGRVTVGERCFNVRCDAVYVSVNIPNKCISLYSSSSTKIFFRSGVGFLDSNNVYIFIMHKVSKIFTLRDGHFFDIDTADLEILAPKTGSFHLNLNLKISFCVITKAVLRCRLLVVGIQRRANALG
jgi:hypothetical protein